MDLFAIFSATPQELLDFTIWGIMANMISSLVLVGLLMIKSFTMSDKENEQFLQFIRSRREFIQENCSVTRRTANGLLFLLPGYSLCINSVYAITMFWLPGIYGVVKASIVTDKMSIVQLLNYRMIDLTEDK